MTRIGIITDVHADVHALRDALFQMEHRLHCEMVICCGDVIDYDMNGIYPGSGPQADGDTAYLLEQAAVTVPDPQTAIAGWARTKRRAADVLIVGHTHVPMYRACEYGIIVNPGALLRSPADDGALPPKTGGTFGVLDPSAWLFTVHRASDGSVVSTHQRTA